VGLLDNFKKKRAIKSYIEKLPNVLVNDYGRQEYYTQQQINQQGNAPDALTDIGELKHRKDS
jgi:hypothetical protein